MPTIGQYLDNGARLQTKMVQSNDYLGQWGDVELLLVSNALVGAFDAYRTTGQGEHGLVEAQCHGDKAVCVRLRQTEFGYDA